MEFDCSLALGVFLASIRENGFFKKTFLNFYFNTNLSIGDYLAFRGIFF